MNQIKDQNGGQEFLESKQKIQSKGIFEGESLIASKCDIIYVFLRFSFDLERLKLI